MYIDDKNKISEYVYIISPKKQIAGKSDCEFCLQALQAKIHHWSRFPKRSKIGEFIILDLS